MIKMFKKNLKLKEIIKILKIKINYHKAVLIKKKNDLI
jgi:hypothetical protein